MKILYHCKKYTLFSVGLCGVILIWRACSESVSPPDSMRFDLNITVIDTSGNTRSVYGTDYLPDAKVYLNSISYGNVYDTITDSAGNARFDAILPDMYNIAVSKRLVTDYSTVLLNGQVVNTTIAGGDQTITLIVQSSKSSKIIFSEIYYNGSVKNPILTISMISSPNCTIILRMSYIWIR
jgi:hypothetical protein